MPCRQKDCSRYMPYRKHAVPYMYLLYLQVVQHTNISPSWSCRTKHIHAHTACGVTPSIGSEIRYYMAKRCVIQSSWTIPRCKSSVRTLFLLGSTGRDAIVSPHVMIDGRFAVGFYARCCIWMWDVLDMDCLCVDLWVFMSCNLYVPGFFSLLLCCLHMHMHWR